MCAADSAKPAKSRVSIGLLIQLLLSVFGLAVVIWKLESISRVLVSRQEPAKTSKFIPVAEGTWRFIVSGDSRYCGDVVMPAIAAQSIERYRPSFYWHLGDLRAIYKIDEDMAASAQKTGQYLSCESYYKRGWQDFINHQIVPFGTTRFYLGIGNHEAIPPRRRWNSPRNSKTGYYTNAPPSDAALGQSRNRCSENGTMREDCRSALSVRPSLLSLGPEQD